MNHSQDSQTQPVTAMGHTDLELCDENDDQRLGAKHASCLVGKHYDNRSTIPPRWECGDSILHG